jgi:hypothetical protein
VKVTSSLSNTIMVRSLFRKRKQWRLSKSEANDGQSNIDDAVFNSSKVATMQNNATSTVASPNRLTSD